jgi:hypothetical protein
MELLLSAHGEYIRQLQLMKSLPSASAVTGWKSIEATICQTKPACQEWTKPMLTFAGANSGGPGGELLLELCGFAKAWRGGGETGSNRIIGGKMLDPINLLKWRGKKFPHIKVAILKCLLASPSHKIQLGMCQLLMPTMLRPLQHKDNLNAVEKVESILAEARFLCKTLELTQEDLVKHVGFLDVKLCLHILEKGKDFEDRVFRSEDEIRTVRHSTTPSL